MIHLRKGRKLKRTSSHRKALLRNLATSLFEHKKIETTLAKAKELRPYAEHIITRAKHALAREKQGILPSGQTIDIHNRRIVNKDIKRKAVLQELFDTIAPTVENRAGGYTRIIKTGFRRGDGGASAIIELVDWSAPQDGVVSLKAKNKAKRPKAAKPKEEVKHVAETKHEKAITPVVVEETVAAPVVEVDHIVESEAILAPEVTPEASAEEKNNDEEIKA